MFRQMEETCEHNNRSAAGKPQAEADRRTSRPETGRQAGGQPPPAKPKPGRKAKKASSQAGKPSRQAEGKMAGKAKPHT